MMRAIAGDNKVKRACGEGHAFNIGELREDVAQLLFLGKRLRLRQHGPGEIAGDNAARFGCESQGGMTGATAGVKYKRIRLHGRQIDHQIEIRAGGMHLARAIIGGDATETLLHMFLYIVRVLAPIHALAAS